MMNFQDIEQERIDARKAAVQDITDLATSRGWTISFDVDATFLSMRRGTDSVAIDITADGRLLRSATVISGRSEYLKGKNLRKRILDALA